MKSKWLVKNLFKKENKSNSEHNRSVEKAAISVFKKYDKTFIDLAKYDRGEKIFNKVSN